MFHSKSAFSKSDHTIFWDYSLKAIEFQNKGIKLKISKSELFNIKNSIVIQGYLTNLLKETITIERPFIHCSNSSF